MQDIKKLDIGCGSVCEAGFTPWDIKGGKLAERLEGIADGQLDAIKASHVLEHFSFSQTIAVLSEWARALRIGGELRVAVPDFDYIVNAYLNGHDRVEGYLMGGHTDENDYHKAIFNRRKIVEALGLVGLEAVSDWKEKQEGSCALLPVSLNIKAIKRGRPIIPLLEMRDTICLMSMPRLAWTENMHSVLQACSKLGMGYARATGAFWGQCLQRLMQEVVEEGRYKFILTVDYDSVFEPQDIVSLRMLIEEENLDVVASLQAARERDQLLANLDDGTGKPMRELTLEDQCRKHWPCLTAHFGLTLICVDALKKMPLPWFLGVPSPDGSWGDERIDDDIYFWRKARDHGLKCSIAPTVQVGHLQALCSWLGADLRPRHQYMKEYFDQGRPKSCWNQPPSFSSSSRGQETASEQPSS